MRLWHQYLIHYLPNKQLLGQHRECCALRGKGWGKKHSVVNYVFKYGLDHLYAYHLLVMKEMSQRGYVATPYWYGRTYRGQYLPNALLNDVGCYVYDDNSHDTIYSEHNDNYLRECLINLKGKHAELINGKTIHEMLIDLDMKLSEHM